MKERSNIDWTKIKAEYLRENISYRKLAERHGISVTAISAKAKKGNWVEQRKKRQEKIAREVMDKVDKKDVKKGVKALTDTRYIAEKLISAIDHATDELDMHILRDTVNVSYMEKKRTTAAGKEIPEKMVTKSKQRLRVQKGLVNTKAVKDLAYALNELAEIFNANSAEDDEFGVIIIPEQEKINPPVSDGRDSEYEQNKEGNTGFSASTDNG